MTAGTLSDRCWKVAARGTYVGWWMSEFSAGGCLMCGYPHWFWKQAGGRNRFKFRFWSILALWLWGKVLTFLSISFSICEKNGKVLKGSNEFMQIIPFPQYLSRYEYVLTSYSYIYFHVNFQNAARTKVADSNMWEGTSWRMVKAMLQWEAVVSAGAG